MKLRMLSLLSIILALGIRSMDISAKEYHALRVLTHAIPEGPYIPTPMPLALENRLDSLVFHLSHYSVVKDVYININDSITPEHSIFEELQTVASEDELNELINHPSPIVRIYAYRALIVNDMNLNCDYELNLLSDTTCIDFYAGNEVLSSTVQEMVQRDLISIQ